MTPRNLLPAGPGPLQPFQREISGQLLGVPAGAKLLTNTLLKGNGQSLPFQLRFNPEAFPVGGRVELRAAVDAYRPANHAGIGAVAVRQGAMIDS